MRKFERVPLLLILFCLAIMGCSKKKTAGPPPPISVYAETPKVEDTNLYLEYVGHADSFSHIEVRSQVEGALTESFFTEGQFVSAQDLLLTVDVRPFQAQLEKAQGALAQSAASLQIAEETVKRYTALARQDYVSRLNYDTYLSNVNSARAEIQQNQADIETAKINIDYCYIRAPVNGVTGKLLVDVGNLVQNGGEILLIVNQIQPIYVYFYAPQKDFVKIRKLQSKEAPLSVEIYLREGDTCIPCRGNLNLINNQLDTGTGSILLRAELPNENLSLWPGEFVTIHLVTEEKKDALLVPTDAILIGPDGHFLFIVTEDLHAKLVPITLLQRMDAISVIEGISRNDRIIIEGQVNLIDGSPIVLRDKRIAS